jgi:hypothetical protein
MSERTVLRSKDWKLGLQRAFDGKRNGAIDQLGGLHEVVRVDIANSADESESTVELHEALADILPSWHWRPSVQLRATAMMIDVLRAYQPRLGGPKVVELLRGWRTGDSLLEISPNYVVDVKLEALRTLEAYYPTPLDDSREWDAYVDLLYDLLGRAEQPAHVLKRLHEVDAKNISARVESIIADSATLTQLISKLIDSEEATDALSFLYGLCVPDRKSEYEQAVEQAGGAVKEISEKAIITTAEETIPVDPGESEMLAAIETASNQFTVRLDLAVPYTETSGNGHGAQ